MPLTVITLKKVPASLRGDLTKWMQEIATGVYVGNFNRRVREQLWERVLENTATGEATMSFAYQNEIGYQFETHRTQRQVIDYDGIPLVLLTNLDEVNESASGYQKGFSNASKYKKARRYTSKTNKVEAKPTYIVLDIETDGLDHKMHQIIELGAVKVDHGEVTFFHRLIEYNDVLPEQIINLTGITNDLLDKEGYPLEKALQELVEFIGTNDIVGYGVDFDMRFINRDLKRLNNTSLTNKVFDLMRYVKKEKMLLKNYKLETVVQSYDIASEVPHRALEDAKLIYELSTRVKLFLEKLDRK